MLYNIYDQNNQLIGQIEENTSSEAWRSARRQYEMPGRIILDVREVEDYQDRVTRVLKSLGKYESPEEYIKRTKRPNIIISRIEEDLRTSMVEENNAAGSYMNRAEYARLNGDEVSARLWEHIAEEEIGHYNEFRDRFGSL